MWDVIAIIMLFTVVIVVAFVIGHEIGYRHGYSVAMNEIGEIIKQARKDEEEIKQQIAEVESRIDKVSSDSEL